MLFSVQKPEKTLTHVNPTAFLPVTYITEGSLQATAPASLTVPPSIRT